MKIFFPDFDLSIGSQRIPFYVYKQSLLSICSIELVSFDDIAFADVAFCLAGSGLAQYLSINYPRIYIVTVKPHYEIVFTSSSKFPLVRLLAFVYYIFKNYTQLPFISKLEKDNIASDLLICDTPRLKRFFSSRSFKSFYLPLLDVFIPTPKVSVESSLSCLNIVYHGNLTHFNSNLSELIYACNCVLSSDPLITSIHVHCVSRVKFPSVIPPSDKIPFTLHYHPFSVSELHQLISKCDIGWAPNQYSLSSLFKSRFLRVLLSSSTQNSDILSLTKFSVNFGRMLLFAQYHIPFLTHPCEESIANFSYFGDYFFYDDQSSLTKRLAYLASSDNRKKLSHSLSQHFNYFNFLSSYTKSLYSYLLSEISNK